MSRSDPPQQPRHALVVDDDPALRGLFTTLLARKGFTVDTAPNGREAYAQLRRNNYNVILLDLMMPEVNGIELLDRLGRDGAAVLPRVIVMTGAGQRAVENVDTSRVWGLVKKPFDIDHLVGAALQCAEGKGKRSAS